MNAKQPNGLFTTSQETAKTTSYYIMTRGKLITGKVPDHPLNSLAYFSTFRF